MNNIKILLPLSVLMLLLTGCWNKIELDELGFVMGVALDKGKNGVIQLTTQVYRATPIESGPTSSAKGANITIKTSGASVFEAVRDIPTHLGRKAQWSHMRMLVVGEELAKNTDVGRLLDFFVRDHEPRHTVSMAIAKGRAADLLKKQPTVETTTGQQLKIGMEASHSDAAKTVSSTLLDFAIQVKSQVSDAAVSYVGQDKKSKSMFTSAGVALFKKSKMTDVMPSKNVEGLLMLRNEFKSSTIELPCKDKKLGKETIEVIKLMTKLKPKLKGNKVSVKVMTKVDAAIGELKCTELKTEKDEKKYISKAEKIIKDEMLQAVKFLKAKKMDVIGVGNDIYAQNPNKWKKLKNNWSDTFAEIPFDIRVDIRIITSGTSINKPTITETK